MASQAWRLHGQGTLLEMVDPTMKTNGCVEEVERVLHVALLCVHWDSPSRPSMARVVSMLKGEIEPEAVIRQSQFSNPEYNSFLAAAQSGSGFMTAISERDEVGDAAKPLLNGPGSSASTSSSTQHSSLVELSTIAPR